MKNIALFMLYLAALTFATSSFAFDTQDTVAIKKARFENDENLDPWLESIIKSAYMPCEAVIMAGNKYFARQNYARASDAFDKCPISNTPVLRMAIKANTSAKRYTRASELCQEILEPSIIDKRNSILVHMSAKNYQLAISVNLSIDIPSREAQDDINLATAYFLIRDFDQAREIFRKIPIEDITHNEDRARAVCSSCSDGDFARARLLCESILSSKNHISDVRWVAERYGMLKDYAKASEIYESIINHRSHNIQDLIKAAKYNLLNNNLKRAHEIADLVLTHKDCTKKIRNYILANKEKFPL